MSEGQQTIWKSPLQCLYSYILRICSVSPWDGNQPYHNLPYYQGKAGAVYNSDQAFEDRYPDLLVIELGANDFSSEVNANEPWPTTEAFRQAWVDAYIDFIGQLRQRYNDVPIVIMTQYIWPHDRLNLSVQQVQQQLDNMGADPVYVTEMRAEMRGCMWHPVADEHTAIAESLASFISTKQLLGK
ncbi:hypothetical protein L4D76_12490 [Photobacterium sagamiensis]|uniref:hypothetical protein n=1 Tax=Photobacterium sagamiensis TaxID=2910241 RepID=UPI003D144D15